MITYRADARTSGTGYIWLLKYKYSWDALNYITEAGFFSKQEAEKAARELNRDIKPAHVELERIIMKDEPVCN